MERTLAIIKPDAVKRGLVGDILKRIKAAGLGLCGLKLMHLTRRQAELFYEVHKARPFYGSLCECMSSGPVVIAVLEGDGAIARWGELMGATDPAKATPGTIRKEFGLDVRAELCARLGCARDRALRDRFLLQQPRNHAQLGSSGLNDRVGDCTSRLPSRRSAWQSSSAALAYKIH